MPSTRPVLWVGPENKAYIPHVQAVADYHGRELVTYGYNTPFWKGGAAGAAQNAGLIIMWNGWHGYTPHWRAVADEAGVPWATMEWGWIPQKHTYQCQPSLGCGDSILCKDLAWVTQSDMDKLAALRKTLQEANPLNPRGYVLVPLQILADTTMVFYTTIRTHVDLISRVQELYPDKEIIVRPHPKGEQSPRLPKNITVARDGTWADWASEADMVVGATSSTLVESGVLGVPTIALGRCPLQKWQHGEDRERCLAGHMALQYLRNEPQGMLNILERFNKRPIQ